jgi:hypothetical protein
MTIIAALLMVGCAKNDVTLFNKGKKDWQEIEVRAGGKVFEIKELKGGANHTWFFKSNAEDGGKVTAKLDGNVHQAEFGYFTPNMSTSAIISLEDNGTITPY